MTLKANLNTNSLNPNANWTEKTIRVSLFRHKNVTDNNVLFLRASGDDETLCLIFTMAMTLIILV